MRPNNVHQQCHEALSHDIMRTGKEKGEEKMFLVQEQRSEKPDARFLTLDDV